MTTPLGKENSFCGDFGNMSLASPVESSKKKTCRQRLDFNNDEVVNALFDAFKEIPNGQTARSPRAPANSPEPEVAYKNKRKYGEFSEETHSSKRQAVTGTNGQPEFMPEPVEFSDQITDYTNLYKPIAQYPANQ